MTNIRRRAAGLLVLVLLLGAHLALRIIPPWPEMVFPDGRIVLPDNDSWFHYREALYTNAHFPAIQRTEDVSRYPEVERVESSGLWDVTLAGLARIVALGQPSPRAVTSVCLLLPPLLGAAVFLLLFRVAAVNGWPALGVWLVAWAVLAPGNTLTRTGLGFCDHHVAEMTLSLVCLLALLRLLRRANSETPQAWWRPAWLESLPLVLFVFTWIGAPIYLLLTVLVLALAVVATVLNGERAKPVALAGARLMIAFVVIAGGAALLWPNLVMERHIFPAALAGAAVSALCLPLLAHALKKASARFGALRSVIGLLVLAAVGLAIAYTFSAEVRLLWGYLLGRKSPLVQENAPVTLSFYFKTTGVAGFFAIATLAIGIVTDAWRRRSWLVTAAWSFSLLMLWYRTWDYNYLAGLHALVLTGCALGAIFDARTKSGKPAQLTSALVVITACVAVLAIGFGIGGPPYVPRSVYRDRIILAHAGWRDAMDWLSRQPPPPAPDFSQPLPRGRAGVLTVWESGNLVNALGGWPAVSARYMDAEAIEPFFLEHETAVRAAPLRKSTVSAAVRYIALEASLLGTSFEGAAISSGRNPTNFHADETIIGRAGQAKTFTTRGPRYRALFAHRLIVEGGAGLQHFRLVYESPQETFLRQRLDTDIAHLETCSDRIETSKQRAQSVAACLAGFWHEPRGDAFLGHIVPSVRLFEQVEGARIAGRTAPNARVTFSLPLRATATARRFVYEQTVTSDAAGAFTFVVPYATAPMTNSDVQIDGLAEIVSASLHRPIAISEAAVRDGLTVNVTDFANSGE